MKKEKILHPKNSSCGFSKYLLELVGQFFRVQLDRRQRLLVLCQVEHLDGVGKHRTHLLLLVCCIFTRLQVNTSINILP